MLHTDVEDIGGVSSYAAQEARSGSHGDERGERGRRDRSGEVTFKLFIDTKAGSRVGQLAEERGGELLL